MKFKPDLRMIRRLENKTQAWVAEQVGVPASTIFKQENNMGVTNYARVEEIFDLLGYDIFVEKREEI